MVQHNGKVGMKAAELNRNSILIELNKDYILLIKQRVESMNTNLEIFDNTEST